MSASRISVLGVCCAVGVIGLSGCASSGDKKAAAAPMDEAAMMEVYMKAATPGPMHAYLTESVGTWDGVVKHWMDPSQPPSVTKCVTTVTTMLDGRFTRAEVNGEMDMGGHKMPFGGFGLYGYDNVAKRFESTWVDSMGTCTARGTGSLSADKKTMTWTSTYLDPMTGKDTTMREVDRHTGPNTTVMEMYGNGPDGKEVKMMEITSTRRGGR